MSGSCGQGDTRQVIDKDSEGTSGEWELVSEDLVHVELSGIFQEDLKQVQQGNVPVKWVGLDTDQPIVQIGGQVFAGHHESTVGTSVILNQEGDYVCKTDKKLVFKRVFLKPKEQ